MSSQEDKSAVIEQLKTIIVEGKLVCHRCRYPISGKFVTQIDMFNGRIVYTCPNEDCDNNTRAGYRTFRALEIVVPSMSVTSELAEVEAPAPPVPEEVEWDGDEELMDDDDDGEELVETPVVPLEVEDDPDSEE